MFSGTGSRCCMSENIGPAICVLGVAAIITLLIWTAMHFCGQKSKLLVYKFPQQFGVDGNEKTSSPRAKKTSARASVRSDGSPSKAGPPTSRRRKPEDDTAAGALGEPSPSGAAPKSRPRRDSWCYLNK